MQHLKNIEKLFSKNFIESPLIDSFEAGNITITSGELVACDPLTTSDMQPFTTKFPIGDFPVLVHVEKESNCVAYVEIVFQDQEAKNWQMAVTKDQNINDLEEEEIFGFPGESGMGCIMDLQAQDNLQKLEREIYKEKGEQFCGIYEEFFRPAFFNNVEVSHQFTFLKPSDENMSTIFAFETGFGEGFYASYISFDNENKPIKFISEFIEIEA